MATALFRLIALPIILLVLVSPANLPAAEAPPPIPAQGAESALPPESRALMPPPAEQAASDIQPPEQWDALPPSSGQGSGDVPPPELWGELPPLSAAGEESGEAHTIWTCSMHPSIQLPEFGQCPICFMDLIEVTVDSGSNLTSLRQIALSEEARELARVETTPVIDGFIAANVRMVGKVDYDETLVSSITAWLSGRIDKLHVAYTGSQVKAGQPMAEIYSPELLSAQAELIEAVAAAEKLNGSNNPLLKRTIERTRAAARKKLELLGLTEGQIDQVVTRKSPSDHITLIAPISGIVISKEVTEGMYVKTGTPIYTIADLNKLWVILEAYESDLHAIHLGQVVEFSTVAYPGRKFTGQVAYIDPVVDTKTRTVRVRLNIDNPGLLLKPGMFVRAVARSSTEGNQDDGTLLIPASAPLLTGKRAIVYIELPDKEGVYEGREIILGSRRGDFYEVISGLTKGELVVNRGNFKIDSAIQIQARPSMMNPYMARESTDPSELPSLFFSKLNRLNETFARLSQAVHVNDTPRQQQQMAQFSRMIESIQTDFLDPEIRLAWQELAMLLNADLVLMQEAGNEEEQREIYAEMATHFYQVRTRFQLPPPVLVKEGSDAMRSRLGSVLARYLDLQKDLADDAEEKSLADIPDIVTAAENLIAELAAAKTKKAETLSAGLGEAIREIQNSTDIAELRTAFYPLSRALIEAVETYGVTGSQAVYEHYCPMAFNDTGANWLDTSEQISNPYFGDEMLRCGEVLNLLKLED